MTDNSILNMVGGEKHINPHYDIKEESANKGFTGIEVNGVRFSNIQEMLVYMDKQRNEIIFLEKENAELKAQIEKMKCCGNCSFSYCKTSSEHIDKDGNIIFHCWNIEKRTYCDVGKNGKYQCWQLRN